MSPGRWAEVSHPWASGIVSGGRSACARPRWLSEWDQPNAPPRLAPTRTELLGQVLIPETVTDWTVVDRNSVVDVANTMPIASKLMVFGAAISLVAAACSGDDASPEVSPTATVAPATTTTAATPPATTTTTTATAPSTTTTVAPFETPLPAEVTETYAIPGFGFSIDYPTGWAVDTRDPVTIIASSEEALQAGFSNSNPVPETVNITLDHRTVAFLQEIGLAAEDPTAQDLLEFNSNDFGWTDVGDPEEVEVFGTTALVVRFVDPQGDFNVAYQGVRPDVDDVFLLNVAAPTDAFLPTWEAMLESITATE